MSVTLAWRSFQDTPPPHPQSVNLGSNGGTLGRATDNQFAVYDPEQFASRHHARIFINQGAWYIEDISSTGTLINDNIELFNGHRHLLSHGDILTIGECEIEVQILPPVVNPDNGFAPHSSAPIDNHQPMPSSAFNIDDFFNDEAPQAAPQPADPEPAQPETISAPYIPMTEMGDLIEPPAHSAKSAAIDDAFNFDELMSDEVNSSQVIAKEPTLTDKPEPEPNKKPLNQATPTPQPANADDTIALRAFLKELNLDPQELIGQDKAEVMRVAGVILRTLTQGMMDVLQARTEVKRHFHMDTTQIQSGRNNPLKFSADPIEAMTHMLKQDKGYMDPIESAEEAVTNAKAHEMAMVSGLQAAIQSTIAAFDPHRLEQEFAKTTGFTFSKKSKYWECFHHKYQAIADEVESTSKNQFSSHFSQHYEEHIRAFYANNFNKK